VKWDWKITTSAGGRSNRTGTAKFELYAADFLPRCCSSKRLRYKKQTKAPNPFRLLLVEVLHLGKVFKNEEYKEEVNKAKTRYFRVLLAHNVRISCHARSKKSSPQRPVYSFSWIRQIFPFLISPHGKKSTLLTWRYGSNGCLLEVQYQNTLQPQLRFLSFLIGYLLN
jgi:hypothetical protein